MSDKIPARFRKTKTDKWAVMAPVADLEKALAEGGKIEVQKKSGDWSTFTVGSLGRPFEVDGVQMCYGYAPGDGEPGAGAEGAAPAAGGGAASGPSARSGGRPSGAQGGGGQGGGGQRGRSDGGGRRPSRPGAAPPPRDDSEPLPVYQGGAEDEWGGEF